MTDILRLLEILKRFGIDDVRISDSQNIPPSSICFRFAKHYNGQVYQYEWHLSKFQLQHVRDPEVCWRELERAAEKLRVVDIPPQF